MRRRIVPFGVVVHYFGYVHRRMKKVINPIVGGRQYKQRKHCIRKIIEMKRRLIHPHSRIEKPDIIPIKPDAFRMIHDGSIGTTRESGSKLLYANDGENEKNDEGKREYRYHRRNGSKQSAEQ
jgi:hypothetical protein